LLVALLLVLAAHGTSADSAAPDLPRACKLLKIRLAGASGDARLLKDMFWGFQLSPRLYQRRATRILGRVAGIYRRELARAGLQGIAVVEPYSFVAARVRPGGTGPNLGIDTVTSLRGGRVVVARDLVDQAETLGAVLAADLPGRGSQPGGDKGRLMKRMWRFSALGPAAQLATTRHARRLRNGVLAAVLARESGHWFSNEGREIERPGAEQRDDLIAAQIGMRLGVSPAAILGYHMWAAMKLAQSPKRRRSGWARFVSRYDRTYRYLERQMDRPRRVHAEGQSPAVGRPLMTESMKQDLRAMPTAEELARFIRPDPRGRKLRASPTHVLHRLHFVHDDRVSAAPGIRSILRRLSPRTRAEVRAVGHVFDEGRSAGTAFLVKAPGRSGLAWVMTNAHVAKHETRASDLEVGFEDAGRAWTGRVRRALFLDHGVDAALLEVELPSLPGSFKAATLLDRPVRAGEALHAIGFPGVHIVKDDRVRRRIVAAPGIASFPRPPLKTIALGREKAGGAVQMIRGGSLPRPIPVVSADTVTIPGSSGSPVFAARGGVIALHSLATEISDSLSEPGGVPDSHDVPMQRVLARIRQVRPELIRELAIAR
jgi:hypothetical protein